MPDVFLSYSREDQPTARQFAEALKREGFSVWWDQALTIGEAFDKITENALDEAKAVVVLWSKHSVDSRWVRAEATQAQASGCLAPVMIEDCKRPIMFELTHTADLSNWSGDINEARWRSFVAELRRFLERNAPVASPAPASAASVPSQNVSDVVRRSSLRSRAALAVGALAVLIILGVSWWKFGSTRPATSAANKEDSSSAVVQNSPVTLAVLPFANLSSDPEQEYFSDGLTEEILNQLAQVRGLRVTGRTSSFSFKGKNEDLRDIATKLGVDNILEGSIRKDGERLRITAQLIDGRNGAHLWSKSYERELGGVFNLQDEVARDVARALSVTLDVADIRRAEGGTTNFEAWDRYAESRLSENREQLLRETVQLDPQFSLAWNRLGELLESRADSLPPEQAASIRREGRAAKDRALALTPNAWWARMDQVMDLMDQKKWAEAEPLARTLMEERPMTSAEDSERGWPYWRLLRATGRVHEVLQLHQQFVQLEPQARGISGNYLAMLVGDGDCAGVEREYRRHLSLDGGAPGAGFFRLVCWVAEQRVDRSTIAAEYLRVQDFQSGRWKDLFARLAEVHGNDIAVRETLQSAFASNKTKDAMWPLARLADSYRDRDLALAVLEWEVARDTRVAAEVIWQFPWTGLRADPRFKVIVRKLALPEYWRSTGNWADHCKPVGSDDFECI